MFSLILMLLYNYFNFPPFMTPFLSIYKLLLLKLFYVLIIFLFLLIIHLYPIPSILSLIIEKEHTILLYLEFNSAKFSLTSYLYNSDIES